MTDNRKDNERTPLYVLEEAEEMFASRVRRLDEENIDDKERDELLQAIEVSRRAIDGFLEEMDHDISTERRNRLYAQMLHRMECADIVRNRGDRREEVRFLEEADDILELLRVLDDDIAAMTLDG